MYRHTLHIIKTIWGKTWRYFKCQHKRSTYRLQKLLPLLHSVEQSCFLLTQVAIKPFLICCVPTRSLFLVWIPVLLLAEQIQHADLVSQCLAQTLSGETPEQSTAAPGMLENSCNSSIGEAVAGGAQVQDQSGLHNKIFSQPQLLCNFSQGNIFTPEKTWMSNQRNDSTEVQCETMDWLELFIGAW